MPAPSLPKRLLAESIGTGWLVFAGLGTGLFAAGVPGVGVGWLGVSLAVGLTVLTMAYAIGHISGCHLNPAVSLGLVMGRRFPAKDLIPYVIAQVVGATAGAALLQLIHNGIPHEGAAATLAGICNGYAENSPQKYSLLAGFVGEAVLTFMFLFIILGSTSRSAPQGFAPVAIGLGLTLIHLVGIPLTNLSVNPARSTGTALLTGGWALSQLWLFWVAPLLGGALAGVVYAMLYHEEPESPRSPLEKLTQQAEAAATRAEHTHK